jgi:hypothetical protein
MKKILAVAMMMFAIGCGAETPVGETEDALKKGCHRSDDRYQYVGTSKNECARIRFVCAEGSYFADACGCGCFVEESCPIIDCAAPPAGCHYEGAVFTPCDQQTCGSLVCDGSNL